MVQNLKIAESKVFIVEAFCLTLFKRIRQKYSEKDEVSHLYRGMVDEKKRKKVPSLLVKGATNRRSGN